MSALSSVPGRLHRRLGLFLALLLASLASEAFSQAVDAFNPQLDKGVYATAVQGDGRILVGGLFTSLNGQIRNQIGRLNSDGSLDTTFNPGANGYVYSLVVQPDGKILVGGGFTVLAGQTRNHLGRLNADGSLDSSFNPATDGDVLSLALQADGQIIVGGNFTLLNGQPHSSLGRLSANGSLDASFTAGADSVIYCVALQADGRILAGGAFFHLGGNTAPYLGRLNTDGSPDTTFVASAGSHVYAFAIQGDNNIIVGGHFTSMNGQTRNRLARLNVDGTLDASFNAGAGPAGALSDVYSLAIQADGKILVGGIFLDLAGQGRNYAGRFKVDGTLDGGFDAGIGGGINSLAIQKDGKILLGGWGFLARLNNTDPALETLGLSGSTLTWQRSGAGPEVWRTTFEASTNGSNWAGIGAGARISGGWQRTGVSIASNAYIRARGFVGSGYGEGSGWFVESFAGRPLIVTQPASRTNDAGTTATFSVLIGGTTPLRYQWRKNGTNLADGGTVSGSGTTMLALSNVLRADAGAYSLRVSNSFGVITSTVANLTVREPIINTQPVSQFVDAGQTAQFTVAASGTALAYQWKKDGAAVTGATGSSLSLSNAQASDSGKTFQVVVTSAFGSVTSAVATLTVNVAVVDGFNPTPNYPVHSIAVQPDRKVLIAGYFSAVRGQTQPGIARLTEDGNLDTSFAGGILGVPFSTVLPVIALQEDGKILIAGGVSSLNGQPRDQIGRFNPDGSLDAAFDPGANGEIHSLVLQADGKILLGGSFTMLAHQLCNGLGRLNLDGSLDTNFNQGVNGTVAALAVQADGKLLVGGDFTSLAGQPRTNLGRFNADGSLDSGFNSGAVGTVSALAVQTNGAIIVGGAFTTLAGKAQSYIGRLNSSGSFDTNFHPSADGPVTTLSIQTDGRILIGGGFIQLGGQPRHFIGRFNPDGSPDAAFNPAADDVVNTVTMQSDGKILVGGNFNVLDGQGREHLARLTGAANVTNVLSHTSSTISWQRSGVGPEFWRAAFDISTNGMDWTRRVATRINGGWQATGLNLPSNATVRARGFIAGSSEGSSWFAESVIGPPVIDSQPAGQTNGPFAPAAFKVTASGQAPLTYQWLKDGIRLQDGGVISGARAPTLNLASASGGEAGSYQVIVSNAFGSVTSRVANLVVFDPVLTSQPQAQAIDSGQSAAFSITADGTAPLSFRWLRNGSLVDDVGSVSGAQTSTLTVSNALGGDAGTYRAVVSNAWGSVTSLVATLTVADPILITDPVSQEVQRGQTVLFNVAALGTQPLQFRWRKDGVDLPGATSGALTLTNVQAPDAGDYDAVVSSLFGSLTSHVARLAINLANADAFNPGANGPIYAMVVGADGKILVGGNFTIVGGQGRTNLARLNPDGSLDSSFKAAAGGYVYSLAVQSDGSVLVGGEFTTLNGRSQNYLGRLYPGGTTDTNFNPNPNWYIFSLALQTDGKIVVGGGFSMLGGQNRLRIGRLNTDGLLDAAFDPGADLHIMTLAVQPDGKILVGGFFTQLGGQPRNHIGRLNGDGALDLSFNPGADNEVASLAVQGDGRIIVGGSFAVLGGQTRRNLGRLNNDGVLDPAFDPAPTYPGYGSAPIYCLAAQADGKTIVGGSFLFLGGQARANVGRLNADGTLDSTFNPGADYALYCLAVQGDGQVLAGGFFGMLGGQSRNHLGRLNNTAPAKQSLTVSVSDLTWLRGGSSPEIWRASFETTTDGANWLEVGAPRRIPGGWQLSGTTLPPNATIRARGFITGGGFESSSTWFVETMTGPPLFATQPLSRTNNALTTATFAVSAVGGLPLGYQWLKDGAPLQDGANISGALTAMVTVGNALGSDAGAYRVVITNSMGSITSSVATLSVIDPLITAQPLGQAVDAGQTVTFSVAAMGAAPLSYQWRKGGGMVDGATSATLTLSNVQASGAGDYDVWIYNSFGSITSAVATLSVNLVRPDSFLPAVNRLAYALAVQPDGKILSGAGSRVGLPQRPVVRWNTDGTLDTGFDSGALGGDGLVYCLVVQPDSRIVAGGSVQNQQSSTSLWRLNSDGSRDTNFNIAPSGLVYALALQPDGKLLVGGGFTIGKPSVVTNIARLNVDGTLDTNFHAAVGLSLTAGTPVYSLALQPDGRILLGGNFTTVNGQARSRIARLNSDGSIDTNFNASANAEVYCLGLQSDGRILAGGAFGLLDGQPVNRIGRLNSDGTLDAAFNPNANGTVSSIAIQADGKVLMAGSFSAVSGRTRNRTARLSRDGALDASFFPSVNGAISALALQADGGILVGGGFTSLGGQPRTNLARLLNSDPATQTLVADASSVLWLRSGTTPEISRAVFDLSTNGVDWLSLGAGTRVQGAWRLSGLSIPDHSSIRARGLVSGAYQNGSSWFIEETVRAGLELRVSGASGPPFNLSIRGMPGQAVVIEGSTNLLDWTALSTNIIATPPLLFGDPGSGGASWRFYRVRLQ